MPSFDELRRDRRIRSRRRRLRIAILLAIALVGAAVPPLLLPIVGPDVLASRIGDRLGVSVTVGSVRGNWWRPLLVEDLRIEGEAFHAPRIRCSGTLWTLFNGGALRFVVEEPVLRCDRQRLVDLGAPPAQGAGTGPAASSELPSGSRPISVSFEGGRIQLAGRTEQLRWSGGLRRGKGATHPWSCLLEVREETGGQARFRARFGTAVDGGVLVDADLEVVDMDPRGWTDTLGVPLAERIRRTSFTAEVGGSSRAGLDLSLRGSGKGRDPGEDFSIEADAHGKLSRWALRQANARMGGLFFQAGEGELVRAAGHYRLRCTGAVDALHSRELLQRFLPDRIEVDGPLRFEGRVDVPLDAERILEGTLGGRVELASIETELGALRAFRGQLMLHEGRLQLLESRARVGAGGLRIKGEVPLRGGGGELSVEIDDAIPLARALGPVQVDTNLAGRLVWRRNGDGERLELDLAAPRLHVRDEGAHRIATLSKARLSGSLPLGATRGRSGLELGFEGGRLRFTEVSGHPLGSSGILSCTVEGEIEGGRRTLLGDPLLVRLERALAIRGSWSGRVGDPLGPEAKGSLELSSPRLGFGAEDPAMSLEDFKSRVELGGRRLVLKEFSGRCEGDGSARATATLDLARGELELEASGEALPLRGGVERLVARFCPMLFTQTERGVSGRFGGRVAAKGSIRGGRWWEGLDGEGELRLKSVRVRDPELLLQLAGRVDEELPVSVRDFFGERLEREELPASTFSLAARRGLGLDAQKSGFRIAKGRARLDTPWKFSGPGMELTLEGETSAGGGGRFVLRSDQWSRLRRRFQGESPLRFRELGAEVEVEDGRFLRVRPALLPTRR